MVMQCGVQWLGVVGPLITMSETKLTVFSLGIIVSVFCFQDSVLSLVIPKNFTKLAVTIILSSYSIFVLCKDLFLDKNCI
jgi:hypothetical protein